MKINKHDTNGIKPLLGKGELGYDDYVAGGDVGRVYVGTGSENIALAEKSEIDLHASRTDNPHSVTKAQVGLGNVDNTADVNKNVATAVLASKLGEVRAFPTDNNQDFNSCTDGGAYSILWGNYSGTLNTPPHTHQYGTLFVEAGDVFMTQTFTAALGGTYKRTKYVAGNWMAWTKVISEDANGNVGIGTSSPSNFAGFNTLTITGKDTSHGGVIDLHTSDGSSKAQMANTSDAFYIGTVTNHSVRVRTGATTRLTIEANGHTTVGAPVVSESTGAQLRVEAAGASDSSTASILISRYSDNYSTAMWHNYDSLFNSESFNLSVSPGGDTSLNGTYRKYSVFGNGIHKWFGGTTLSNPMTLAASGNLLIGTTTDDGVSKLRVNGNVNVGSREADNWTGFNVVTLSSHSSAIKGGIASSGGGSNNNFLFNNCYYDNGVWKHSYSGSYPATLHEYGGGNFIWYSAASDVGGNAADFYVDMMLTGGKLGIGTSNPAYKVDTLGESGNGYRYSNGTTGVAMGVAEGRGQIGTTTSDKLELLVGSTPKATITTDGNIGIGVVPSAKLQIGDGYDNSATVKSTELVVTSNDPLWQNSGAGIKVSRSWLDTSWIDFMVSYGGSRASAMTLNSSGNLLVGTSVDNGEKLHVAQNGGGHGVRISSDNSDGSTVKFVNSDTNGRSYAVGSTGGSSGAGVGFSVYDLSSNSSRLLIPASGNLLVGTTIDNGVDKLQVNGSISSGAIQIITNGDLNDYKTRTQVLGTYPDGYVSNIPINDHGYLEVIVYSPDVWVMQRFTTLGVGTVPGRVFVRCLVNSVWSAWTEK